jgi:hypothetical protein
VRFHEQVVLLLLGIDDHYRATGALNLSLIAKTPSSEQLEEGVSGLKSCGGGI